LHRFWRKEHYYENDFAFCLATTQGETIQFPVGSYWICVDASERPLVKGFDNNLGLTGIYVTLLGLHPETQQPVQVEFFPQARIGRNEQFSRVENEMLVIALASTGLVL
jgi:hypothetical protein